MPVKDGRLAGGFGWILSFTDSFESRSLKCMVGGGRVWIRSLDWLSEITLPCNMSMSSFSSSANHFGGVLDNENGYTPIKKD